MWQGVVTGPVVVFLSAVAALVLSGLRPDLVHPDLPGFALWAALGALVAEVCLHGLRLLRGLWLRPDLAPLPRRTRAARGPGGHRPIDWVVIDGSNVLYWRGNAPSLETVAAVVRHVQAAGQEPVVWFDANVGYKVGEVWLGPWELSRALNLPRKRVFVAEKGTPADPSVLAEAGARGGRIVSNDRYRDWVAQFPRLGAPGFLIRGGVRDGAVWLESDAAGAVARAA